MQRRESNGDTQRIRKKDSKSNQKKKRSISTQERSDLIEYYHNQKVSEYSQQSLQPKELEETYEKSQVLPVLKKKESSKQLIISKVQINAKLKKQLNLLGFEEEQDIQENAQSTNELGQRPFSSKYAIRQSKERYNQIFKNQYEFKDSKSTSRIYHQYQLDNSVTGTNEYTRANNQFHIRGSQALTTTNTLFLSNSFAKRENFVLTRGVSSTNKYGNDQNMLINNQQTGQKYSQKNMSKSFILNSDLTNSFELSKQKGSDTNKSTYQQSKDLFPFQFSQQTYQEEGVDRVIGNAIQLRQKDETQKAETKIKDDTCKNSLLNLPIHHTKRISCSPINSIEKRTKIIHNNINTQQISSNDYIKFQNQLINILLPQPTQEEKQDIEFQKEKEGLLKYFNFPKSFNLQENQINKLEQSKLVFQAYLSYRSPKYVAEKMKDQSLLQVLQKVKSQYVSSSQRNTRNQFYSKNNSPTASVIHSPKNNKEQQRDSLKDNSYDSLKQENSENEPKVNFFNREQYPKQPNLLSELVRQLLDKEQQNIQENGETKGTHKIIQDSFSAHFLFNRSKSVDRGSLVKQFQRDQFNNQFNLEMMKLRTKERKLQLNDQKTFPHSLTGDLAQNIIMQNSSSIGELNEISQIINDKSKEFTNNQASSPNENKKTSKSINKLKKQYFHQKSENKGDNLPSFDNIQSRMSSSRGLKSRVPTAYNDFHINIQNNKPNQQEKLENNDASLNYLIDSLNSETLFSDKSKENIKNQSIIKTKNLSQSKKRKSSKIINDINKLQIVNNRYNKKMESPIQSEKLNNSFDSYQPTTNHLINNKKLYQKSKKYFKRDFSTNEKLVQINQKSPQQKDKELKIDPEFLNEQNQKYMILRKLIRNKQYEIQLQN